jgi:hypothetical protein
MKTEKKMKEDTKGKKERKDRDRGERVVSVCSFFHTMKNTYCLFQIKFITEYTNVQHVIVTQI